VATALVASAVVEAARNGGRHAEAVAVGWTKAIAAVAMPD
jgi:hypothetical protein